MIRNKNTFKEAVPQIRFLALASDGAPCVGLNFLLSQYAKKGLNGFNGIPNKEQNSLLRGLCLRNSALENKRTKQKDEKMGISERIKGSDGERELGRLLRERLGDGISRNLEQSRAGGHDLAGLPVALEVKRYATATDADIRGWWLQAERQGQEAGMTPALAYRLDRRPWRFVLPLLAVYPGANREWTGMDWTATVGMEAFTLIVREML